MKTLFFPNHKRNKILLMTTALFLISSPARAIDDLTTPTGETVAAGAATFNRPVPGQLDVNQTSDRAVINWDRFDIGKNAETEFFQPNSSALAVNRVTGDKTDPTQILGTLKSNGNLMVLDRNGVLFGKDSVIDVGGIVASTGDVTNDDVMDGDDQITINDISKGVVENKGNISVADAGLAALVAPVVRNSGVINAKLGRVSFGAGSKATVDLFGDDLVTLAVDSDLEQALIHNRGEIHAEAGTVRMETSVAEDIVDNTINMDGIIDVSSIAQKAGKIILSGAADTTVKGDMFASGQADRKS